MAGEAREKLRNASQAAQAIYKSGNKPNVPSQSSAWTAPGRLGDPTMQLGDDPRVNAQLLEFASKIGLDKDQLSDSFFKLNENSSLDEIAAMIEEFDSGLGLVYNGIPIELPEDKDAIEIERKQETISGGDGQDMTLYVYRPAGQSSVLPSVVYSHGKCASTNRSLLAAGLLHRLNIIAND